MLVQRMKRESNIDYENDWKVITIFIGGNDLCRYCKDKVSRPELAFPLFKMCFHAMKMCIH